MTRRGCFVAAFWAWGIGLCCFILPFLSGKYRGEAMHMCGLELMFAGEGAPFNGYLWVAALAGIVGLICLGSAWSEVDIEGVEDKAPLFAFIIGAVGAFCLSKSTDMYLEYNMIGNYAGDGWGKEIAVWCFIGGAICALVAYLLPMLKRTTAGASSGANVNMGLRTGSEKELIQLRLRELRTKFLNGQITADEYEKTKDMLEKMEKEQAPAAPPGGWLSPAPKTEGDRSPAAYISAPRPQTGKIICPSCGVEQNCDRTVCWHCQTKLIFEEEERVRCGKCGKEYVAPKGSASAACPYCGSTYKIFPQE